MSVQTADVFRNAIQWIEAGQSGIAADRPESLRNAARWIEVGLPEVAAIHRPALVGISQRLLTAQPPTDDRWPEPRCHPHR